MKGLTMKITVCIDVGTRERLEVLRRQDGISFSEAVRRGVWLLYQDKIIFGGDDDDDDN